MDLDSETVTTALRSGDADRVNELLDAVEDAERAERARLLAACFDDCWTLYDDADDGYVRQSVVRLLVAADPHLGVADARTDEEEPTPDDLDLGDDATDTRDAGDYRDALVEFYLTALEDDDGRVRNAVKRELRSLAVRFELLGERDRLDALHARLDELADCGTGKKRDHVVEAREQVRASARPGGRGLESVLVEFANETRESDE